MTEVMAHRQVSTAAGPFRPAPHEAEQKVPDAAQAADELVQLFKLLADSSRLRILYILTQQDEMHVRALCELLDQSQPAVSHHLGLLRRAGLIALRRAGKHNFYRLQAKQFEQLGEMLLATLAPGKRRVRLGKFIVQCDG